MMKQRLIFRVSLILSIVILVGCATIQEDWQKATQLNSVKAYEKFLQKYPQNELTNVARDRIEELVKSDWQEAINSNRVEDYKLFLKKYPESKFTALAEDRIKDFMKSASCRGKKALYKNIKKEMSKKTKEEFERLYGDCIYARNFCEYCGQPAVGWCTMRHKYVCNQHRYFQRGGTNWRCP